MYIETISSYIQSDFNDEQIKWKLRTSLGDVQIIATFENMHI